MIKYVVFIFLTLFAAAAANASIQMHTEVRNASGMAGNDIFPSFVNLGNYYLFDFSEKLSYHSAAHFCRRKDAYLTSIESEEEFQQINSYLLQVGGQRWYWTGANCIDHSKYKWISTGQPVVYIKRKKPDYSTNKERCVALIRRNNNESEFEMYDKPCWAEYYPICKVHTNTIVTTCW